MSRLLHITAAGVLAPLIGLWITSVSVIAGVAVILAAIAWRVSIK